MFENFESLIANSDLSLFHEQFPTVSTVIVLDNETTSIGSMDRKSDIAMMLVNQINMGSEMGPYYHTI
jgi:hypothetical protein